MSLSPAPLEDLSDLILVFCSHLFCHYLCQIHCRAWGLPSSRTCGPNGQNIQDSTTPRKHRGPVSPATGREYFKSLGSYFPAWVSLCFCAFVNWEGLPSKPRETQVAEILVVEILLALFTVICFYFPRQGLL